MLWLWSILRRSAFLYHDDCTVSRQHPKTLNRITQLQLFMIKQALVEVDFRVCCNHKANSSTACTLTVKAIRKQFNNIVEINAVKPYGSTEDMCVIGTAKIKASMKTQFEKDLKKLKINSTGTRKIKRAIVSLPNK